MNIFLDTETSAFWKFKLDPTDDSQPYPVQVAWVAEDDNGRTVSTYSAILAQDQWCGTSAFNKKPRVPMTAEVVGVHGITDEMVDLYGQPPDLVLNLLWQLMAKADKLIGHNIEFDVGVLRRWHKAQHLPDPKIPETYCTMYKSTAICKIPAANGGGWKRPKLGEAYHHFMGKPLVGAHDALVDVYACRQVYRGIQRHIAGAQS